MFFLLHISEYGLLLRFFEKRLTFSELLRFLFRTGLVLPKSGYSSNLVQKVLLLLALISSIAFRNVFLKILPKSSFRVKGLLPNGKTFKRHYITSQLTTLSFQLWMLLILL